jgi:hypothetical protein
MNKMLAVKAMELLIKILFWVWVVTFIPGNLMVFMFKKPGASLGEIFFKGSFALRDLDKYVREVKVPLIKLLITIGAFSFMAMVLIILISGLNNRF